MPRRPAARSPSELCGVVPGENETPLGFPATSEAGKSDSSGLVIEKHRVGNRLAVAALNGSSDGLEANGAGSDRADPEVVSKRDKSVEERLVELTGKRSVDEEPADGRCVIAADVASQQLASLLNRQPTWLPLARNPNAVAVGRVDGPVAEQMTEADGRIADWIVVRIGEIALEV